jgi:hypothetical protein
LRFERGSKTPTLVPSAITSEPAGRSYSKRMRPGFCSMKRPVWVEPLGLVWVKRPSAERRPRR